MWCNPNKERAVMTQMWETAKAVSESIDLKDRGINLLQGHVAQAAYQQLLSIVLDLAWAIQYQKRAEEKKKKTSPVTGYLLQYYDSLVLSLFNLVCRAIDFILKLTLQCSLVANRGSKKLYEPIRIYRYLTNTMFFVCVTSQTYVFFEHTH